MKKTKLTVLLSSIALALGVVTFVTPKQKEQITFATYTNGDAATYYSTINATDSGNTLLTALRTLNLSKRKSTVGYSSMGTTPSGQFKYTDYDPDTVKYDSNGQPYGTKILSFYTNTSATSWNREHVWPNSHGGGSGGDAGSPYPDADIHMPRPTISSENSSRGNSFFVEGMNHSSAGWDPYTAGYSAESRGEAARITFYCTLVNSKLILAPSNTTPSGTDPVTGQSFGSGHTMGNLETLIKWNIDYPINQRERNRNEGAEYLQGNRNAFVDHPEYACRIWGNVNSTIKSMCDNASWETPVGISISKSSASLTVDESTTINATATDSSTITWTTSDATVADISSSSSNSGTNITISAIGPGTATITASATIGGNPYSATCTVTVTSSGGGGGGGTIDADSYSILHTDLADGSYPTTPTSYTTASGLSITAFNAANFSSKIQIKKSGGYIYNNDPLELGSLTLNGTAGSLTVYAGTSKNPSTTTISGTNGVYDLSGYNYFKVINSSGSVASCSSIQVGVAQNEKIISSFSVKTAPTKTTYIEGERFDPTGLVIIVNYSDNTSEDIPYSGHEDEFVFDPDLNDDLETSYDSVSIYYGNESCSQPITVNAKTLSSISVSVAPNKTTYVVGDTFDPTGLVITRTYNNNTSDTYTYANHESEFSFYPNTSTALTTSNTSVTIYYGSKYTTQNITVNPVTLSSISVSTVPNKTTYTEGEYFNPNGLVITRNYNNKTSDTYTYLGHESEFTFVPGLNVALTTSNTSISITYVGKSVILPITVNSSGGSGQGSSGSQRISANTSSTYYQLGDICPTGNTTNASATCDAFDITWLKNSGTEIAYNYAEMRIYQSHSFTITPKSDYEITSIALAATSGSYANAVGSSSLTNCSKEVSGTAVTLTPNDGRVAITFANNAQSRISYIVVDYEYVGSSVIVPDLALITIAEEPTKTTYNVGDYFDPTGLVINRYYDNSTSDTYSYANHEAEFSFSPNLSTLLTVDHTSVTIYYSGLNTTLNISVNKPVDGSISASVDRVFYVGETLYSSDINVVDSNGDEVDEAEFLLDEYTFTYNDAPSGGQIVNKTFAAVIHSLDTDAYCDLTVQVARASYQNETVTDSSISYTDLPTSYQTTTNERTAASGIKYIAYNCANYSGKMQFKASGGYLQTTSPLELVSLTINDRETNTLTVFASNDGSNFDTTITGTNDVYNLTGYSYFKVIRNSSGAAYCSSLTIKVKSASSALNVANYIMYEDTVNQCETNFDVALTYLSLLSESELNTFQTSNEYVIASARTRLEAWAAHLNKTIHYEVNNVNATSTKSALLNDYIAKDDISIIFIIGIVSALVLTGAYCLIYKRKQD